MTELEALQLQVRRLAHKKRVLTSVLKERTQHLAAAIKKQQYYEGVLKDIAYEEKGIGEVAGYAQCALDIAEAARTPPDAAESA